MCRYGSTYERKKCMHKHEDKNYDDANDEEEIDDEENDYEENDDDDQADKTFENPFRSNSRESLQENENPENEETKSSDNEKSGEESFKCEWCIFETKDSKRFKRHKFEIHSVKGRYVCFGCHEEFLNRKHFNCHQYKGCNPSLVAQVKMK